ncbi:MAG: hypothetical protein R2942_13815 [Ignavibacteria bacterium]
MKYFDSADAKGKKETQFFDNNGSRGIYHKGWFACAFGPLYPWLNHSPGTETWDSKRMSENCMILQKIFHRQMIWLQSILRK